MPFLPADPLTGRRTRPHAGSRRSRRAVTALGALGVLLILVAGCWIGDRSAQGRHAVPNVHRGGTASYTAEFVGGGPTVGWPGSKPADAYPAEVVRAVEKRYAPAEARVEAHQGARVGDVLRWRMPGRANLVVVQLGANDWRSDTPAQTFDREYSTLLWRLRAASPRADLVCLGLWQPRARADAAGELAGQVDSQIAADCRAERGAYVSLASFSEDPAADVLAGGTIPAPVYPNETGQQDIADAIGVALFLLPPLSETFGATALS